MQIASVPNEELTAKTHYIDLTLQLWDLLCGRHFGQTSMFLKVLKINGFCLVVDFFPLEAYSGDIMHINFKKKKKRPLAVICRRS